MKVRLRKRNLIIGMVMAILVSVLLTNYAFSVDTSRHPMTLAQANALVQNEMQLGASVSQVKAWLDAKGIEHGVGADGTILSIIRDTHRTFLSSSDIQVTFIFDRQRRLIGHSVHEVFTGL